MTTDEAKFHPEGLLDRKLEDLIEVGPDGVERLFGMTLEEVKALREDPTAEDIAWAERVIAERRPHESA